MWKKTEENVVVIDEKSISQQIYLPINAVIDIYDHARIFIIHLFYMCFGVREPHGHDFCSVWLVALNNVHAEKEDGPSHDMLPKVWFSPTWSQATICPV